MTSGIDAVFAASNAGMTYERQRLEAAVYTISIANTPIAPGQNTKVVGSTAFKNVLGLGKGVLKERSVYDPSSPMADRKGMVHYPDVNLVDAMTTLITADRGYKANVRAFNALRGMLLDALSLGTGK